MLKLTLEITPEIIQQAKPHVGFIRENFNSLQMNCSAHQILRDLARVMPEIFKPMVLTVGLEYPNSPYIIKQIRWDMTCILARILLAIPESGFRERLTLRDGFRYILGYPVHECALKYYNQSRALPKADIEHGFLRFFED